MKKIVIEATPEAFHYASIAIRMHRPSVSAQGQPPSTEDIVRIEPLTREVMERIVTPMMDVVNAALQDQQKAQQAAGAQGYDAYPESGDAYSLDEDVPVPHPQPRKLTPEEQLKRMKDAARQMEANKRRSQQLSRNAASPAREGRPAV